MAEEYPAAKIRGIGDSDKVRIYLGGDNGWLGDPPLEMTQDEAERRIKARDWSIPATPKDGKK